MVTKRVSVGTVTFLSYILAKNHMVTKQRPELLSYNHSYILAKNHMVTKLLKLLTSFLWSYILAKNHMVTKQRGYQMVAQ